jgi:fatty acid desaturase
LIVLLSATFLTGCFTSFGILSIFCFAFTQAVVGWMGHSMSHSRDLLLQKVGRVFASLCGGFSLDWWSPKHNMHHMFTNSQLYDDDIKHDYKVYLFPFLYLKWRFDSYTTAITSKNLVYLFIILDGYNFNYLKLCSINLL